MRQGRQQTRQFQLREIRRRFASHDTGAHNQPSWNDVDPDGDA